MKRWKSTTAAWTPGYDPATYYYYDGWNLIQEGASGPLPDRVYVHGGRVDEWSPLGKDDIDGKPEGRVSGRRASQIVASWGNSQWYHHHYDARGHCIMLTGTNGSIQEQYDYDAFGLPYIYRADGTLVPPKLGSPAGNRFLFTGREWIKEHRLYDYRNRMYQPELGRFLQPDPIGFVTGDYNLYRYCHNDPVNRSDPTGLISWEAGAGLTSWGNGDWNSSGSFNRDIVSVYRQIRSDVSDAVNGVKDAVARSPKGSLTVKSARVAITSKTGGYYNDNDTRGGNTPNPIKTSHASFKEGGGMLSLTYHLHILVRINLSRGGKNQLFAKLREPDHRDDFFAAKDRYQAAADTLLGRRFYSGAAATQGLKDAVDPVIQQVFDESYRNRDRSGDHDARDIMGDYHLLKPNE